MLICIPVLELCSTSSVNCSRLHGCVTVPTAALHVLHQVAVPAAQCQMSPGASPLQVQACRGYAERMEEEHAWQNLCPAVLGMLTSVVSLQCASVSPFDYILAQCGYKDQVCLKADFQAAHGGS